MTFWDKIRNYLRCEVTADFYDFWLKDTAFLGLTGDTLYVSVPDPETRSKLETECGQLIQKAIKALELPIRAVKFVAEQEEKSSPAASMTMNWAAQLDVASSVLNPYFTFDSFVVSACNQLAYAAAKSVATNPSRSYNPLILYGGAGTGKTHLMHAIGRQLMDQFPTVRLIYTSGKHGMTEIITGLRTRRVPPFHERYREADVVLIDDIQLLYNTERTQEEFFHTFKELHGLRKQIVISSDLAPKEIRLLLGRLLSNVERGLMAEIQPPDLDTKMAILDKKAEMEGVKLPAEVRSFLASTTKSNLGELEGALVKLLMYSSLTKTPINLKMSRQVMKHLVRPARPPGARRRRPEDVAEKSGF